jgi:hypothetical protein
MLLLLASHSIPSPHLSPVAAIHTGSPILMALSEDILILPYHSINLAVSLLSLAWPFCQAQMIEPLQDFPIEKFYVRLIVAPDR